MIENTYISSLRLNEPPIFHVSVDGRPRVKKNSRRIFARGKTVVNLPSEKFSSWETRAFWLIKRSPDYLKLTEPIDSPLFAIFLFYFKDKKAEPDTSNLVEGIQDLLQNTCVIKNDRQIISFYAEKFFGVDPKCEAYLFNRYLISSS